MKAHGRLIYKVDTFQYPVRYRRKKKARADSLEVYQSFHGQIFLKQKEKYDNDNMFLSGRNMTMTMCTYISGRTMAMTMYIFQGEI